MDVQMRGTLFIVAAPSGAGKSSLVAAALAQDPAISLSISFTTRAPRPGEQQGHHYHFVTTEAFEVMIRRNAFFEYARVYGDWKGTAMESVEPQLAAGQDVLLEIDWQGARQVKAKVPSAVSIFILPPSRQALEERLRRRGQDSEEVIAQRMAAAVSEMRHYEESNYLIINGHFEEAVDQLVAIFKASRADLCHQKQRHACVIRALVSDS